MANYLPEANHRPISKPAAGLPDILYRLRSVLDHLKMAELFPLAQPLEVELGSGDGSFLVEYARRNPGCNFIGVERLLGRIRKLERKGRRAGLTNLRGIRIESSYFLEYLLPPQGTRVLHIYFPDPWPKRKHERHRLISERFPEIACRALSPGGAVYLRTDNAPYFAHMLEIFDKAPAFRKTSAPADLLEIQTDFERDFRAQGFETLQVAYARV